MQVNINSVHFRTDKKLDVFITERIEKLSHLYDGIIGGEVTLRLINADTPDNKIAEVRLLIKGNDLFAKKQCTTFEEAADTAVEALRKQLTRHKGKLRGE
jgi:putative sigma-54 modulation protein